MNTIGDRIKEVRNDFNLNQDSFGGRIGLKKSALSLVEKNKRALTDSVLRNIINEFCVNEPWLKDGIGKKYNEKIKKEKEFLQNELQFMSSTLLDRQTTFFKRLKEFDEHEQLEMVTSLEEIYSILNPPGLDEKDYFDYYEIVSGMFLEINRYIDALGQPTKPNSNSICGFLKIFQDDILKFTKLFIPDIDIVTADESVTGTVLPNPMDAKLAELVSIYNGMSDKDKEETLSFVKFKLSQKKKGSPSTFVHGEEATAKMDA